MATSQLAMVSLTVMPVAPVSTSIVAGMVPIETATYAPPLLKVIGTLSIVDEVGVGVDATTGGGLYAGAGEGAKPQSISLLARWLLLRSYRSSI